MAGGCQMLDGRGWQLVAGSGWWWVVVDGGGPPPNEELHQILCTSQTQTKNGVESVCISLSSGW